MRFYSVTFYYYAQNQLRHDETGDGIGILYASYHFIQFRIERTTIRDTEIDGVTLPKGSLFSASVYAVHHDPEIWPEPSKFDPERWIHTASYLKQQWN